MLDAHYNGDINLANYWTVGDTRIETLEPIPAGTTGASYTFQTVEYRIIGFNREVLENKTGVRSRSAVTIQTSSKLEGGSASIHDSHKGNISWADCNMRSWCNNDCYNDIYPYLRNLVKPVIHNDCIDKVFLLSDNDYDNKSGYEIYKGEDGALSPVTWTRSPSYNSKTNTTYFGRVTGIGSSITHNSDVDLWEVAPAFCL